MTPPNGHPTERDDTLDHVYKSLSHPARRRILLALAERNPRTTTEFTVTRPLPGLPVRDAAVDLSHVHLPHLDEAGFVDWDSESGTITRGPNFAELRPHLAVIHERE